jgi:tetratricopeptide (TPR) repeat protein
MLGDLEMGQVEPGGDAPPGDSGRELARFERARALCEESLALARKAGDRTVTGWALKSLGEALRGAGEHVAARPVLEACVTLALELGNWNMVGDAGATLYRTLYRVYRGGGGAEQPLRACREHPLLRRALAEDPRFFTHYFSVYLLDALGHAAREAGDYPEARALYSESLDLRRKLGDVFAVAQSLEDFAGLAAREAEQAVEAVGQASKVTGWRRAATLLGAAEALCETLHRVLPVAIREEYARAVKSTCEGLGGAAFASAWAEGRALSLEQAIDYALSATDGDLPLR